MKKVFLFLTVVYLNIQEAFGQSTLGGLFDGYGKPDHLVTELGGNEGDGESMVLSLIGKVIDLMLYFAGTVAVGFIIYGGIRLITDFGTDKGKDEAKNILLHSIIGLLVVFISIILIENTERFVKFVIGASAL